jgi:hypothetical protein
MEVNKMIKIALRYTRYTLSALTNVAFSITFN